MAIDLQAEEDISHMRDALPFEMNPINTLFHNNLHGDEHWMPRLLQLISIVMYYMYPGLPQMARDILDNKWDKDKCYNCRAFNKNWYSWIIISSNLYDAAGNLLARAGQYISIARAIKCIQGEKAPHYFQLSHLCHNPWCINPFHVIFELRINKFARKLCSGHSLFKESSPGPFAPCKTKEVGCNSEIQCIVGGNFGESLVVPFRSAITTAVTKVMKRFTIYNMGDLLSAEDLFSIAYPSCPARVLGVPVIYIPVGLKCWICGNAFTKMQSLIRHVQSIHLNIRYVCVLCGQDYADKHTHARHFAECRLKLFKCVICSKTLTTKDNLNRHGNTHISSFELSIECCLCCGSNPTRFDRQSKLVTHVWKVHGVVWSEYYEIFLAEYYYE